MIKINNNTYNEYEVSVSFGEYNSLENGKVYKKETPVITFKINDIGIEIEMLFDKVYLNSLKEGIKTDISTYISQIIFFQAKRWGILTNEYYECYLIKINDTDFELFLNLGIDNEKYKIVINDKVRFDI